MFGTRRPPASQPPPPSTHPHPRNPHFLQSATALRATLTPSCTATCTCPSTLPPTPPTCSAGSQSTSRCAHPSTCPRVRPLRPPGPRLQRWCSGEPTGCQRGCSAGRPCHRAPPHPHPAMNALFQQPSFPCTHHAAGAKLEVHMWRCAGKHKASLAAAAPAGCQACMHPRHPAHSVQPCRHAAMQLTPANAPAALPAALPPPPHFPQVWYEWAVTQPLASAIHNPAGRSYFVGL